MSPLGRPSQLTPLLYLPRARLNAARSILPTESLADFSEVGEPGGCEPLAVPSSMTLPREVKRCRSFVEFVLARLRMEGRRGDDGGEYEVEARGRDGELGLLASALLESDAVAVDLVVVFAAAVNDDATLPSRRSEGLS